MVGEVGLTLTEVFSAIEKAESKTFQYTEEQEAFFAENPDYLAYFDNLLRGLSPLQIQNKFRFSNRLSVQYLKKLDKLKLLEWLPKNKVRLLVKGEPIWTSGGPLALKLRNDIFASFIAKERRSDAYFFLHDYLLEDRDEILRRIAELLELAKRANARAKFRVEESKPAGLYISLQNFRWNIDNYLLPD